MVKAGGILAIIVGLLGLLAGLATLFLGGLGAAISASGSGLMVGLGWGGILFSLLVVVYGAVAFAAPRAASVGLALCAIGGMVLGGTLVAILMVPALVAAAMTWMGSRKVGVAEAPPGWPGIVGATVAPILAMAMVGGYIFDTKQDTAASAATPSSEQVLQIGQTARSSRFEVTLRKLRFTETVADVRASPGTVFAVLDVLARCVDSESRHYMPGDLLVELDGKTLKFDRSEAIFGLDSPAGTINPMTEKAGYLVYKIPAAAANASLYWTPGRSFDRQRFALAVPAPPSSEPVASGAAPANGVSDKPSADIAGSYAGPNGSRLEIRRVVNGALEFALLAIGNNGNTGEVDGVLAVSDDGYGYRNAESDCQLGLRGAGEVVSVSQRGTCGFGLGVTAEGGYRRKVAR